MEHTQHEIRQPFSMPVTISVPDYPRLREMKTQLQDLKATVKDRESRIATLTRENFALDREAESANPDQQVFERQAVLKREIKQAEHELALAKSQASRVEDEHGQWVHEFAWKLYRKRLLGRELAEASNTAPQMRSYQPGERPIRPRLETLIELDECVSWLAVWTNDPDLAKEAATIQAKLAEARQAA